jgi:methylated-DNA-[protein]-cysteine S-methyltransferase
MKSTFQKCPVSTSEGTFVASYSDKGLARLNFPNGKTPRTNVATTSDVKQWHKITERAVKQSLAGKPIESFPPMDLTDGTEFQRNVWAALQKISRGKTKTYTEIAESVRKPKAARATGRACGANPIPLLIPCHRVLASGGKLGGFSGGLDWKRKLLAIEKVTYLGE